MIILTNNPSVEKKYRKLAKVKCYKTDLVGVLKRARTYVHKHYKLLSHPLSGSIKPDETLFKSVMIEESNKLDYRSLNMIEEAIRISEFMIGDSKEKEYTKKMIKDFELIDLTLVESAYQSHNMFGKK